MRLEAAYRRQPALAAGLPEQWRQPLLHLALAWLAVFALFAPVWAEMALLYWDSSTFNHILFVPLILLWLVKLRAPALARMKPQAWWPGLALLAAALFIWLLGDVSGLALATHLGVVLALQASALAILGPRIAAALLFPLAYALFLVPVGDELVPILQMVTARLTIVLTTWSGIPAHIDGVFIDTPAGLFEVAEACSGVKFLIAMVALGVLAAHVCFRSWSRRIAFMILAVSLPILANGVRAWGTIYIAQSLGIEFAAGFDHIFYGWIFFALVVGLLLAVSWRFFDRPADDGFVDAQAIASSRLLGRIERFRIAGARALLVIAALCLVFLAWAAQARQSEAVLPEQIVLPEVEGWHRVDYEPAAPWEPRASGAEHRLLGSYRDGQGARVDVFYALYAAQEEGREAGTAGEGALVPDSGWRWHSSGPQIQRSTGEWLQAPGSPLRLAVTHFRHRELVSGNVAQLKLSNMRDRLTFSPRPTGMLIVSATETAGNSAERTIRRFLAAVGPLGEWMDRLAQMP